MAQNDAYLDSMIRVPIKNVYAGTIPAYSIMAVVNASRVNGIRYSHVDKPSTTVVWQHLMNGPTPLPQSATGYGFWGMVPGKYLSGTPANGDVYGPKPSQWELEKDYPGGFIVDGIEDSTNKILFGRLPLFMPTVLAKCYSAIAADATTGTIKLCSGPPDSPTVIASMTIAATYNPFQIALQTDDVVEVQLVNGRATIVNARTIAKFIEFTVTTSALATTDASKASQSVTNYWGGYNPGSTVTIYNKPASSNYLFSGAVGHKGYAVWDDRNSKYMILQMECP